MRVQVKPMRERGAPIVSDMVQSAPGHAGVLLVTEVNDRSRARHLIQARLLDVRTSTEDVLPPLLDARMLYVKEGKMRLDGHELIDGASFGQTWSVEVSDA